MFFFLALCSFAEKRIAEVSITLKNTNQTFFFASAKAIIICFFNFFSVDGIAQTEVKRANPDRPDQSDGIFTLPQNSIQLENGFLIGNNVGLNNFMFRYGATDVTEVRLSTDFGYESNASGLKPIGLSIKQKIADEKNLIPAITFIANAAVEKLASDDFNGDRIPLEFIMSFENTLSDSWVLSYNLGTSEKFDNLIFTLNAGYIPMEKVFTFVEYYTNFNRIEIFHNMDVGIYYEIVPQLHFDIAFGGSFSNFNDSYYVTSGLTYLLK